MKVVNIERGIYKGKLAHQWREKHGLGGGWTCDACGKRAADCYGYERVVCSGQKAVTKS